MSTQPSQVLQPGTPLPWRVKTDSTCSGAWLEIVGQEDDLKVFQSETVAVCAREMTRYYEDHELACESGQCPYEFEPECWEDDPEGHIVRADTAYAITAANAFPELMALVDRVANPCGHGDATPRENANLRQAARALLAKYGGSQGEQS